MYIYLLDHNNRLPLRGDTVPQREQLLVHRFARSCLFLHVSTTDRVKKQNFIKTNVSVPFQFLKNYHSSLNC